MNISINLKVKS